MSEPPRIGSGFIGLAPLSGGAGFDFKAWAREIREKIADADACDLDPPRTTEVAFGLLPTVDGQVITWSRTLDRTIRLRRIFIAADLWAALAEARVEVDFPGCDGIHFHVDPRSGSIDFTNHGRSRPPTILVRGTLTLRAEWPAGVSLPERTHGIAVFAEETERERIVAP